MAQHGTALVQCCFLRAQLGDTPFRSDDHEIIPWECQTGGGELHFHFKECGFI